MPILLRIRLLYVKKIRKNNRSLQKKFMKEMGQRRKLTKDRREINWFPDIDEKACAACGICVDFCSKGVFEMNEKTGIAVVVNPYACVMLCRGCMPKCPSRAISFPDPEDFKQYVYYM